MLIASKQYDFCVNNLLLAAALIFSNVTGPCSEKIIYSALYAGVSPRLIARL